MVGLFMKISYHDAEFDVRLMEITYHNAGFGGLHLIVRHHYWWDYL